MSGHAVRQFSGTSDFSDVSAARRFVRAQLVNIDPDVSADLQLAVSELVTNAVEHGKADTVTVDIVCEDDEVVLMVTHSGSSDLLPDVDAWKTAPADAVAGRGLGIVRRLATSVSVQNHDGRVSITVRRSLR